MTPSEIIEQTLEKSFYALTYGELAAEIETALQSHGCRIVGPAKFAIGDRVTKIKGSSWTGKVVGFYSTTLTPVGYAVESENEPGSVQIYPEAAIRALGEKS